MSTSNEQSSRITLKLSGESLMGQRPYGIDPEFLAQLAEQIAAVHRLGVQIALVIGGGNIFRGVASESQGIERTAADYMGMLATVINSLALQSALQQIGIENRVMSAIPMQDVCEPYIYRRAIRHLEKDRVIICAAGTGNPYFTTDSAAVLRAAELQCDRLFKATIVDGVYSADPKLDKTAQHLQHLSYYQALAQDLKIMDGTAFALARDRNIPITIFSILQPQSFLAAYQGRGKLSTIDGQSRSESKAGK